MTNKSRYGPIGKAFRSLMSGCAIGVWLASASALAHASSNPLEQHMQNILTGDGYWRAPNPEYLPNTDQPEAYGIRFKMSQDKSHATGELFGIFPDEREVQYFSMLAFYNPVTDRVITQQIGWNGLYLSGENPVQPGEKQILDMIEYAPNGAMKIGRHVMHFGDASTHRSDAYELDETGSWQLRAEWTWVRLKGNKLQ